MTEPIEKKVEDMTPAEMLMEIHRKEREHLRGRIDGINTCPECHSGYLIYQLQNKRKICFECGYKENETK